MLFIFALSVKGWIESLFSCSRIEPRNAVDQMPPTKAPGGEKKLEFFFCQFFSKSRGRPSSRCRSVLARRGCPAPSRSRFGSDRKKSENFSKSRGQLISRCRSIFGRRVDTAWGRCRLACGQRKSDDTASGPEVAAAVIRLLHPANREFVKVSILCKLKKSKN